MAVTSVSNFLARIKRYYDYNITDSDLDSLLIDYTNDSLKSLFQYLYDAGIFKEITRTDLIQTVAQQEYRDVRKALIVGDKATFTGTAGDTIDVTIDSTAYADIDISAATDIDDVVTAINTATSGTQASADANGYLQITSTTTGSTSNVTIADGTSTVQTVIAKLFSDENYRTYTGLDDVDDTVRIAERTDYRVIRHIPYRRFVELYPDPTRDYTSTPDYFSIWENRIYFGPTPSEAIGLYLSDLKVPAEVTSSSNLPYNTKYDPILAAEIRMKFLTFMEPENTASLSVAIADRDRLVSQLIVNASHNTGENNQVKSRRETESYRPEVPDNGTFTY